MGDGPFDMTELRQAAIQMHELYTELKGAGFSRGESLELLARTIAHGVAAETEDDSDEAPDAT